MIDRFEHHKIKRDSNSTKLIGNLVTKEYISEYQALSTIDR
ncbi:MAG: hypothetical protein WCJ33_03265 [Pseudomonadota bacterium]